MSPSEAMQDSTNPHDLIAPEARADLPAVRLVGESHEYDLNASIYSPEEIGLTEEQQDGSSVGVIAEIAIPNGEGNEHLRAAVVSISGLEGEAIYLLGLSKTDMGVGYNGRAVLMSSGTPLVIGRKKDATNIVISDLWDQSNYSPEVSRKHVSLTIDTQNDVLAVEDSSTNGTLVKASEFKDEPDDLSVAGHTVGGRELARIRGLLSQSPESVELFAGRPMIGRDTFPIEGGVDVRSWASSGESEAIVIDSKKGIEDTKDYARLLDLVRQKISSVHEGTGSITEVDVLRAIYEAVDETIEYDLPYVEELSGKVAEMSPRHRKVNLSLYLHAGKGVCRHMALAESWLGGEMVGRGYLNGRLTAEVNQSIANNSAHEWGRYTAEDGEVYILDPAQHYFGKLSEAMDGKHWDYFRPGERAKYTIGKRALKGVI